MTPILFSSKKRSLFWCIFGTKNTIRTIIFDSNSFTNGGWWMGLFGVSSSNVGYIWLCAVRLSCIRVILRIGCCCCSCWMSNRSSNRSSRCSRPSRCVRMVRCHRTIWLIVNCTPTLLLIRFGCQRCRRCRCCRCISYPWCIRCPRCLKRNCWKVETGTMSKCHNRLNNIGMSNIWSIKSRRNFKKLLQL